jgi:hypothetical protein
MTRSAERRAQSADKATARETFHATTLSNVPAKSLFIVYVP